MEISDKEELFIDWCLNLDFPCYIINKREF